MKLEILTETKVKKIIDDSLRQTVTELLLRIEDLERKLQKLEEWQHIIENQLKGGVARQN